MITIVVSLITSVVTTAALYWFLHRANPTATQTVIDSGVSQAKADLGTVAADATAEVKKVI